MWSTTATAAHAMQAKQMPTAHQMGFGTSNRTMTVGVAFTPYKLGIFDTMGNG